jgi:hypothetical protein
MKALTVSAATLAAMALVTADGYAQGLPPVYREQDGLRDQNRFPQNRNPQAASQTQVVRQRTDALANELDAVLEHLEEHLEEGHGDRATGQLFNQAEAALQEAVHFRQSVRNGTSPQEIQEHFRVLDGQVHALMQAMQASQDAPLRRSVSRLAYADEQLHAAVNMGQPASSEFIARQAHVLAGEAQRLERAVRSVIAQQDHREGGDHHGDPELINAVHAFYDRVEHFHETAETEHDLGHLAQDWAAVDQSWHQVVDLMNRNPHGAYLYRRAQRVGAMHDELSRVIGVRTERRAIRFNVGGVNIQLGR